ncbi:metallophosphoesterase [Roseiarcaceae bacterium H3SJ34-1]|uniref:metallophosphoesterase n=1 Tax=Terripilifer ovatus TaxID=3032367 RepID=UPI003AB957BE|nr:metallophosphoesterase [Roseiarcaceae bacterium H3SJ34-1]
MSELQYSEIDNRLATRLGAVHARQRLGIESAHEAQVFGQGLNFFHIENWYSIHSLIRNILRVAGLHRRGMRNAADVQLRTNRVQSGKLSAAFDGFRILHLSDLHTDMSVRAMQRVSQLVRDAKYDVCVMTGDFRAKTFGPFKPCLQALTPVIAALHGPIYGVLGNHDTVRMLPELEDMGVHILMNECIALERGLSRILLAGIDDAHFFRVDNIEKAAEQIGEGEFSMLLSHTPEIYRQAAHAGFDLLLCGHTHGGQICLPGGIPITLDATLPRRYGAGAWQYHDMAGYTSVGAGSSVVAVRLNCRPEITIHELLSTGGP